MRASSALSRVSTSGMRAFIKSWMNRPTNDMMQCAAQAQGRSRCCDGTGGVTETRTGRTNNCAQCLLAGTTKTLRKRAYCDASLRSLSLAAVETYVCPCSTCNSSTHPRPSSGGRMGSSSARGASRPGQRGACCTGCTRAATHARTRRQHPVQRRMCSQLRPSRIAYLGARVHKPCNADSLEHVVQGEPVCECDVCRMWPT